MAIVFFTLDIHTLIHTYKSNKSQQIQTENMASATLCPFKWVFPSEPEKMKPILLEYALSSNGLTVGMRFSS